MKDTLLLGFRRYMIPIPRFIWRRVVARDVNSTESDLGFMSEEHHLVRNLIVKELPRVGEPLSTEYIADRLKLPIEKVQTILDDLEKHMTFVCRYGRTEVNWAYPVTVEKTSHRITYNTGEKGHAA